MDGKDNVAFKQNSNKRITPENAKRMRILICPTTGGFFELFVPVKETVQGLKWAISRQLQIPQDRINLLYHERILKNGFLKDNHVYDNCRITLLPNMESGMSKGKDFGVMQALASLSDSQVNDFLSGRAPLLLALRLGDHMMFIQLQLSTSQCSSRRHRPSPVTLPPPGQFSVQDHQEIPSPTLTSRPSISDPSLLQKLHNTQDVSSDKKVHVSESLNKREKTPVTPAVEASSQTPPSSPSSPGAVIESMHHIGNGIYSGTFSGTLDPSLQDSSGKPRRDISTILHILNDLLEAHPEYKQQKCYFNPQQNTETSNLLDNQRNYNENSSNIENNDCDLRQKVRNLQMMMEEKKLRRKARRDTRAPYQWGRKQADYGEYNQYKSKDDRMDREPCENEECMDVDDGVNKSYNNSNPNLEHETVAV